MWQVNNIKYIFITFKSANINGLLWLLLLLLLLLNISTKTFFCCFFDERVVVQKKIKYGVFFTPLLSWELLFKIWLLFCHFKSPFSHLYRIYEVVKGVFSNIYIHALRESHSPNYEPPSIFSPVSARDAFPEIQLHRDSIAFICRFTKPIYHVNSIRGAKPFAA